MTVGAVPLLDDLLGRLPFFIKLPLAKGVLVRGIENRPFKKAICHLHPFSRHGRFTGEIGPKILQDEASLKVAQQTILQGDLFMMTIGHPITPD
jgi:hypothetical protein